MLQTVYGEFEWIPWKFQNIHISRWADKQSQRNFIEWIGAELGLNLPEEWEQLPYDEVLNRGGRVLLNKYGGSLIKAFSALYPHHKFDLPLDTTSEQLKYV